MVGLHTQQMLLGLMRLPQLNLSEATTLLRTAYENQIIFFDTAYVYAEGKSEELLGAAIKEARLNREKIYIQTKTGTFYDRPYRGYDHSQKHILATVDESLRRLQTDYIDVLLLHRPDALFEPEEIASAFELLAASGKVRHFGVSNYNPMQIELLKRYVNQPLEFNQLQLSLTHTGMIENGLYVNTKFPGSLDHDGGVLEYSRLTNMTIQTWSPFQHSSEIAETAGLCLDKDKFPELNNKLREIAEFYGVDPSAIVVAWIMRHPAKMQVVAGTTNAKRLRKIVQGTKIHITHQQWYELYFAAGHKIY